MATGEPKGPLRTPTPRCDGPQWAGQLSTAAPLRAFRMYPHKSPERDVDANFDPGMPCRINALRNAPWVCQGPPILLSVGIQRLLRGKKKYIYICIYIYISSFDLQWPRPDPYPSRICFKTQHLWGGSPEQSWFPRQETRRQVSEPRPERPQQHLSSTSEGKEGLRLH